MIAPRTAAAFALALVTVAVATGQDSSGGLLPERGTVGRASGEGGRGGEGGGGSGPGTGGSNEGGGERLPAPFDTLAEAVNLGRLLRRFDAARGRDIDRSDKPRSPEVPLSTFFESIRPLGALKYENQFNYFVGSFTGSAPTLQTFAYEYVFADWQAVRGEAIAPAGRLEAVGIGYQRTFGVGRRSNWVHGALIQPELSVNGSGFVGGSAFYTFAWKPEAESRWTTTVSVGANRAAFANRPLAGAEGGVGSIGMDRLARPQQEQRAEEESRVWRPIANLNLFYTPSPKLTVGLEADTFANSRFGEYLVLPNLTWRPTKHFFVQAGAGWYEVGGRGQAVFAVRANLLQPTPRTSRSRPGKSEE